MKGFSFQGSHKAYACVTAPCLPSQKKALAQFSKDDRNNFGSRDLVQARERGTYTKILIQG